MISISSIKPYYDTSVSLLYRNRHIVGLATSLLACLILLAATLYTAKETNYSHTFNSDSLVFPYLFKDFTPHDTIVATRHGNILEFPLYVLQAILPYNFLTYSIVTVGLIVVTIGAWAALLTWVFGKKYTILICVLLTVLILGSPEFVNDLTGNTIRNIEYPLGLAFIVFVSRILRGSLRSKWQTVAGATLFILFSAAMAGDSLLEYCFLAPLMLAIVFFGIRRAIDTRQLAKAGCLVVGSALASVLIQHAVRWTGIVGYFNPSSFHAHTVSVQALSFSITTAVQQLLSMFGGYILGLSSISIAQSIIYFNFLLLLLTILLCWNSVKKIIQSHHIKSDTYEPREFVMLVAGISFFLTFIIYILADQVLRQLPNGTLIDHGNARYLSILPLLSVIIIVYFIKQLPIKAKRYLFATIPTVALLVVLTSVHYIRNNQNQAYAPTVSARNSVDETIAVAHKNHISVLVTGYWYGATTRFWSYNTIATATVGKCNSAEPVANNRLSWYTTDPSIKKSALLIDHSGRDKSSWNCTDDFLIAHYGKPEKIIYLTGVDNAHNYKLTKGTLQLWVYDYDVRSKIITTRLQQVFSEK